MIAAALFFWEEENFMINAETIIEGRKGQFGIEIIAAESRKAVCKLSLLEGHMNFYGIPYGGFCLTLRTSQLESRT